MKKKIFITGINGFIGSHLANKLASLGHMVEGCDINDDSTIINKDIKIHKINLIIMYSEDIDIFKNFDLIYHLASPIGVSNIIANSGDTFRVSSKINSNLDYIGRKFNTPIIYASSSEVFGEQSINDETPFSIKKPSDSPRWSYAAAKVHGEFLFHSGQYPSAVVRFFNVVGPGQNTPGMVVPTFINAALKNRDVVITNNGIRNYCDIRDAIDQIIPIGINLINNINNKQCFNIGSQNDDNTIDVITLLKLINDVFETDIEYALMHEDNGIIKNRILEFEGTDADIGMYSVQEILENIRDHIRPLEVLESEEAYNESLDHIIGEQ